MRAAWCLLLVLFLGSVASGAETVHVAAGGDDGNPGTAEKPLATIGKAVALAVAPDGPQEIVLHEGTYPGGVLVKPPVGEDGAEPPALLIRAAGNAADGYEKVVIDGGLKVAGAQPVEGAAHVFAIPSSFKDTEVSMWENDTRVRYHSITFPGNMHFGVYTQSAADMQTFDCDYNNLAMHIRKSTPRRPPPEDDLEPIKGDFCEHKTSKYLVSWCSKTYNSLREWQDGTGKDRHSIFGNPRFGDPANHDFRLKPG